MIVRCAGTKTVLDFAGVKKLNIPFVYAAQFSVMEVTLCISDSFENLSKGSVSGAIVFADSLNLYAQLLYHQLIRQCNSYTP